jgi:chemotaxis protein CheD
VNDTALRGILHQSVQYYLKPGYIYVSENPSAIQTVLGSCVGVCLFDKKRKYGGMNHFMLPDSEGEAATAKYGNAAMFALFNAFIDFGSQPGDLVAQIFGGAGMQANFQSQAIGRENILVARKFLSRHDIPVLSEDVSGNLGRKILFFSSLNRALVYKLGEIRKSDFFNYRDARRELHDASH